MKTLHMPIVLVAILLLVACTNGLPTPLLPTSTVPDVIDTSAPPTYTVSPSPVPTETLEPTGTASQTPTETVVPSITPTLKPTRSPVADWTSPVGWIPNYEASKGDNSRNTIKINTDEGAIELNYDVGQDGYAVITHSVDPAAVSDTDGLSFTYKGMGAPNSIEFKLLLRYPGFNDDTTYGITLNRATDTANQWFEVTLPFSEIECWWPEDNCARHGDLLDITMIDRLDFVVKNNRGDEPGSGWILIKDIYGTQP